MYLIDVDGKEILEKNVDLELGYLKDTGERKLIAHHDIQFEDPGSQHFEIRGFYFTDGSSYLVKNQYEDPRVNVINDKYGQFEYIPAEGEEEKDILHRDVVLIIDRPYTPRRDAWDEYDNIYQYVLYTKDELAERAAKKEAEQKAAAEKAAKEEAQQAFLENGEKRLSATESSIDELTLTVADILGGAEE